jgi:hypothetical protein
LAWRRRPTGLVKAHGRVDRRIPIEFNYAKGDRMLKVLIALAFEVQL